MRFSQAKSFLKENQFTWLITGIASFIGLNLAEELLQLNQKVIGVDNFAVGRQDTLNELLSAFPSNQLKNFLFYEADICNASDCAKIIKDVDYVLHNAAIGNVPYSIKNPGATNMVNVDGFINVLTAARDNGAKRFVYASSSSVYGNSVVMPQSENHICKPVSPYAVSKLVNELYAESFSQCYGIETIGLRYFNVFGPRQATKGDHVFIIPQWIKLLYHKQPIFINGDGETTRDFCYIQNVIQANILAATIDNKQAVNRVYNIASGESVSLNKLFEIMKIFLGISDKLKPCYRDFRIGDIRHSSADISLAQQMLDYVPSYKIYDGLEETINWYLDRPDRL